MKPLYTPDEFKNAKGNQKLPFECKLCSKTFYIAKNFIHAILKGNYNGKAIYCSLKCRGVDQITSQIIKCEQCDKAFTKKLNQIKSTKHNFCSQSCAAKYSNAHKTKGTRRSKFEVWIEEQLVSLYPKFEIHFNRKDTINSELDVYIPHLSLAFEFNGIFHYEPIYGADKLKSILNNDTRKMQACLEKYIELCIIDISSISYFKTQKCQKYLDIIVNIIEQKRQTVFEFL